ncbi:glycoside hydrolase family 26 protein [Ornithinimicrobium kibberense]|uniref:Glycoside hydrolase family 26 protein n=1 Tax=Ornithinimicrobium kibberense TaxID=282060 RepID=A0ABV5V6E3_9MICO|nr:glycosyl hydrolase [Ornithinimicrobium kibberense]
MPARARPALATTLVAAGLLAACSPGSGGDAASDGAAPSTAAPAATSVSPTEDASAPAAEDLPPIADARLRFGLAVPEGPTGQTLVDLSEAVGESPSIILFYKDFAQDPPLHELDVVAGRGAEAVLSWEPWRWDEGVDQPDFRLSEITAGRYDDYLADWGEALATWGKPVTVRFAHEMNGTWYPWGESVNGNEPGDYVEAYRHVHDRVTEAGADNVRWMWSPNSLADPADDLSGMYPGDDYVDVVGVDGYNWGTAAEWSTWQSPEEIFGATLDHVRSLAPGKELVVAETASTAVGGDQGQWAADLVSYLGEQEDVTGFVWFHADDDVADWRLLEDSQDVLEDALTDRP